MCVAAAAAADVVTGSKTTTASRCVDAEVPRTNGIIWPGLIQRPASLTASPAAATVDVDQPSVIASIRADAVRV